VIQRGPERGIQVYAKSPGIAPVLSLGAQRAQWRCDARVTPR